MKGTMEGVQNRNGCLFFICGAISFCAINGVILLFPEERPVFLREVNNKMYTVSAYFFGKILSEMPAAIIVPVVHASCLYFFIGFNTTNPWAFPIHCK
jgi:ABC-type multidrug transport system permease subunit